MLTLVIGDKQLSSWSLRPWMLLRHLDIEFEEVSLPLDTAEFHADIGRWSPARRVPVLPSAST
jgi:glutathione S-transferase